MNKPFLLLSPRLLLIASLLFLLAACGGSGGDSNGGETSNTVGTLKSAARLTSYSTDQISAAITDPSAHIDTVIPVYGVTAYRLEYLTHDGSGQIVRASALVALPNKPSGFTSPLLSFQHGTIYHNAEAPSNHAIANEPAIVLASLGYIAVAADYVGYGVSNGIPHPYLLAEPSADAVIDLLTASKTWLQSRNIPYNSQLLLTGYSEGGYVTMAAHKTLQAKGQTVNTTVPAATYNVQLTLDVLLQRVADDNPLLGIVVSPSFLKHLSSSLRSKLRDLLLDKILPDDTDVVFQTDFLDNYLAGNTTAVETQSNVQNWKPIAPVRLFQGRDDETVPYAVAVNALETMQALGAPDITLTDCSATPSTHSNCIQPYGEFMVNYFGSVAEGL